jgi:protein-tyrosine-phosphatase
MRIIFVCTGNLCRSPMAEGLLRSWLERHGAGGITVSSMGVMGLRAQPPTVETLRVCREAGVDLAQHRSRSIGAEELASAERVFTMDLVQKDCVVEMCAACGPRTHLLGAWPRREYLSDVVPDPIGQSLDVYRRVLALIDGHVERIAPLLVREAAAAH